MQVKKFKSLDKALDWLILNDETLSIVKHTLSKGEEIPRHIHPDSTESLVGSSRVDLQACKLEYSIVSPK